MHRGKKISDPVPKVRGTSAKGFSSKDPDNVQNTANRARSQLRKHCSAVTKTAPPSDRLNLTGETSLTDYSQLSDKSINETYRVPDPSHHFPSGATVDRNGWSKHAYHSKSQRPPSHKTTHIGKKHVPSKKMAGQKVTNMQNDLPSKTQGLKLAEPRNASPKKVDFNNQLELRKINADGTYTDSFSVKAGGGLNVPYLNSDALYFNSQNDSTVNGTSTLTDSKALRETEIRFLNNRRPDSYDVRWNKMTSRFTHVDVKVPSSTNYRTSSSRQTGVGGNNVYPNKDIRSNGEFIQSEGYGSSGSEGADVNHGKFNKNTLKDLDRDTGPLGKLKEKIRRQQLMEASDTSTEDVSIGATQSAARLPPEGARYLPGDNPPRAATQPSSVLPPDGTRRLHGDSDPVEMVVPGIVWEAASHPQPIPRKVAAGPPPPVYKGFNEAESKYKLVKQAENPPVRKTNRKKPPTIQIQEKCHDNNDYVEEHKILEEKPRKRVVAPKDKSTTPRTKDVITTSSWRSGQQVILQTLGPAKNTRSSKPATEKEPTKNGDFQLRDTGKTKSVQVETTNARSDLINNEATKVLSEEARTVLNDLHIGQDDLTKSEKKSESTPEKPKKKAVKRKAPNTQEKPKTVEGKAPRLPETQQHIREYMIKQKEERNRRRREEHLARQRAENKRKKQLEELFNKQKTARHKQLKTQHPKAKTAKLTDPTTRSLHVAWEDKLRSGGSHGSDKENAEQLDSSDGSSTITNDDSVGELTPVTTPREFGKNDVETVVGQSGLYQKHSQQQKDDLPVEVKRPPFKIPLQDLASSNGEYRSRIERIQAIKNTAATLQSRLDAEAQRIAIPGSSRQAASLPVSGGLKTTGTAQWVSSSTGPSSRPPTSVTRHDRITGADEDFSVFTSNLPGVQSLNSHLRQVEQNNTQDTAATQIQAAYKGNSVRRAFDWKLPSGKSLGEKIQPAAGRAKKQYEDVGEDSSTFSDITVTDESDVEMGPPRKIGAGLSGRDYHPGDRYRQQVLEDTKLNNGMSNTARFYVPKVNWDKPVADPYSTLNVFNRHYKMGDREKKMAAEKKESEEALKLYGMTTANESVKPPLYKSGPITLTDLEEAPTEITPQRRANVFLSRDDEREVDDIIVQDTSFRSQNIRSGLVSASFHPNLDNTQGDIEEDITLEGDNSYTQSFESEPEDIPCGTSEKQESVTMETRKSQETKKTFVAKEEDFMESDVSSVAEDEFPISRVSRVSMDSKSLVGSSATQLPPRFSPNALERKMAAELNLLESMEESMRQLTGVERSRAISMAQQETVSLAQILKTRQHEHEVQMKELQFKARQESNEASQQLEEARKRAAEAAQNAVQMIAMVRGGEATSLQQSTRKLIQSQSEAAKATAEASRFISETKGSKTAEASNKTKDSGQGKQLKNGSRGGGEDYSDVTQPTTARSLTKSVDTTTEFQTLTKSGGNIQSKSRSTSSRSLLSGDVATARDTQDGHQTSSIRSVSGAAGKDESKSESIAEELSYSKGSVDDYSMNFDESMTEDEVEEKSFRMVLPSESHRRKAKHQRTQSDVSVTSEDLSVSSAKIGGEELHSLFTDEDSFNRFTTEMVTQFMKEEELRAQHQASLLKLREKALIEKSKAELAWLEQQRKRLRNKGSDDNYPQIKKRQRGIILKLEQEQAEIKRRLAAVNLASTKKRQIILKQQQKIENLRKSTQQTWEKVHGGQPMKSGKPVQAYRSSEIHTEDEILQPFEDDSDIGENSSKKGVKSDSEVYNDSKEKRKSDSNAMTKLKNVHLDQRYLTAREKKLRDRRKNAEQLLAWKKKLDDEEEKIYQLEKKAIDVWDLKTEKVKEKPGKSSEKRTSQGNDGDKPKEKAFNKGKEVPLKKDTELVKKDETKPTQKSEEESSISEAISRSQMSRSDVSRSQISRSDVSRSQTSKTVTTRTGVPSSKIPVSKTSVPSRHERSESEGSIPEEIPSQSSIAEEALSKSTPRKPTESVLDNTLNRTAADTYGDDSFVSNGSATPSSRRIPLTKLLSQPGLLFDPTRSPRSPGKHSSYRKGSESESEESLHTETASDQSDVEGRVRVLKDELERRKHQLEHLKKEREKKQKEILKAHELSLMKQIEVYDNDIKRMSEEKNELEHEPLVAGKKPQIKQPRGRDHRLKSAQDDSSPHKTSLHRSESESSRSSQSSSSFEESRDSIESAHSSPALPSDNTCVKKGSPTLESITERNETPTSERARRSLLGKDTFTNEEEPLKDDSDLAQKLPEDKQLFTGLDEKISLSLPQFEDVVDNKPAQPSSRADETPRSAISEILTARSEVSEQISENVPSQQSEDVMGFKPLGVVETAKPDDESVPVRTEEKEHSEDEEPVLSNRSDRYTESSKTDQTLSEKSDVSYTEDFSEADTDKKKSKSLGKQDSLISQDDISEDISIASDVSEKTVSVPLFDIQSTGQSNELKFQDTDVQNVADAENSLSTNQNLLEADEKPTPIHSPRDFTGSLLDFQNTGEELKLKTELQPAEYSPRGDDLESVVSASDLESVIKSTAAAVEEFDSTPFSSPEHKQKSPERSIEKSSKQKTEKLVDTITDDLTKLLLKESMEAMGKISEKLSPTKKSPPPTLPKPSKETRTAAHVTEETIGETPSTSPSRQIQVSHAEMKTDAVMSNLVNGAISEMVTIRNKQRERMVAFDELDTDEQFTGDLPNDFKTSPEDDALSVTPRPGSPVPGDKPVITKEDVAKLDEDLAEIYGGEDEYQDDDEWFRGSPVPNKPPPPYPGTSDQEQLPYQLSRTIQIEEPQYRVPHNKEDVKEIITDAVNVFWQKRRYGEPLDNVEAPDSYFSSEDNTSDLDTVSRKAYKQLLFDLSGEIIREIYKQEEEDDEPIEPWMKPKPRRQRYHKARVPPTTVEELAKLVQDTSIIILGLNGSSKLDKRLVKRGVSKKKDNVDKILVQELREEEPLWINYDEDEQAVKMLITESVFQDLLQDTVDTIKNVFQKRYARQEELG